MREGFHNQAEDVQWLRGTHLRGVPLPLDFAAFKPFVLRGNEDSPTAVNLYVSADPLYTDRFLHVNFEQAPPVYCWYQEFDGSVVPCPPIGLPGVLHMSATPC